MNEALDINNWKDEDEDSRLRRDWWWKTLFTLKTEFNETLPKVDSKLSIEFNDWLKETHGVSMNYDSQGNIMADYEIVDEGKHLFFILKYT